MLKLQSLQGKCLYGDHKRRCWGSPWKGGLLWSYCLCEVAAMHLVSGLRQVTVGQREWELEYRVQEQRRRDQHLPAGLLFLLPRSPWHNSYYFTPPKSHKILLLSNCNTANKVNLTGQRFWEMLFPHNQVDIRTTQHSVCVDQLSHCRDKYQTLWLRSWQFILAHGPVHDQADKINCHGVPWEIRSWVTYFYHFPESWKWNFPGIILNWELLAIRFSDVSRGHTKQQRHLVSPES